MFALAVGDLQRRGREGGSERERARSMRMAVVWGGGVEEGRKKGDGGGREIDKEMEGWGRKGDGMEAESKRKGMRG